MKRGMVAFVGGGVILAAAWIGGCKMESVVPAVPAAPMVTTRTSAGSVIHARKTGYGILTRVVFTGDDGRGGRGAVVPRREETKVIEQTERVPDTAGTNFGFFYEVEGLKPGENVTVMLVTKFPPMRQPDGRVTEKTNFITGAEADAGGKVPGLVGYYFAEEYERVPGEWTMELWVANGKLLEQKFQVYDPGRGARGP